MSAENDKNLMTIAQIKKRLKSVKTENTEIKGFLLEAVNKFQCLDDVAKAIGIVNKDFSFSNNVTWDSVISKLESVSDVENKADVISIDHILETLDDSSKQVNEIAIPKLQQWRNKWMYQVVLLEVIFFILLSSTVAGIAYTQGLWSAENFSFPFQYFFYERPVFIALVGSLSFLSFLILHFNIRRYVASKLAMKLSAESSEFDYSRAFLKNTYMLHSIFRPDIVGLGWLNNKCRFKNI
ncbi:MAG: hypothetical protein OEY29_06325 [Gammaproteobacteria bacterium]|nr:hypothetical protein [Gammaproteobacteria bacterium]